MYPGVLIADHEAIQRCAGTRHHSTFAYEMSDLAGYVGAGLVPKFKVALSDGKATVLPVNC
jgi:hypothetical protein